MSSLGLSITKKSERVLSLMTIRDMKRIRSSPPASWTAMVICGAARVAKVLDERTALPGSARMTLPSSEQATLTPHRFTIFSEP